MKRRFIAKASKYQYFSETDSTFTIDPISGDLNQAGYLYPNELVDVLDENRAIYVLSLRKHDNSSDLPDRFYGYIFDADKGLIEAGYKNQTGYFLFLENIDFSKRGNIYSIVK